MKKLLHIAVPLMAFASFAHAGVVFLRDLPTGAGVNNAVQAQRSNIKWAPGGAYMVGDDFTLAQDTRIGMVSVWMVAEDPNTTAPTQELNQISLYGGPDSAGPGFLTSTYSWSLAPITYLNGATTQRVFQINFTGLNWFVQGGVLMDFAVLGLSSSGHQLSLHGSNAGLSNSTQMGADDRWLEFDLSNTSNVFVIDNVASHIWDKGNDINVMLTEVPEPATAGLFLAGAAALFLARRRRQA